MYDIKMFKLLGKNGKVSKEFKVACKELNIKYDEESVIGLERFLLILSLLSLSLSVINLLLSLLLFISLLLLSHFIGEYPKIKYKLKLREESFVVATTLIDLSLKLYENPNLEDAILKLQDNVFSRKLKNMIIKGLVSKRKIENLLIEEIKKYKKDYLIKATYTLLLYLKERKRENKSADIVINGLLNDVKKFSSSLYFPTLIIFAVGSVIPLVVITFIPVLLLSQSLNFNILLISLLLFSLIFTYAYSNYILIKAPPSFGKYNYNYSNYRGLASSISLFSLLIIPSVLYFFSNFKFPFAYVFSIFGLSLSISLYCYSVSKKFIEKIKYNRKLEEQLPNYLYHLSLLVSEGRSIEDSIDLLNKQFNNELSNLLANYINQSVKYNVELAEVINLIDNDLVKNVLQSLIRNKNNLKIFERVAIRYSSMIEKMNYVKREMLNLLEKNVKMTQFTYLFFSPIISAIMLNIIRILSTELSKLKNTLFSFYFYPLPLPYLFIIFGIYNIFLSIILEKYISNLVHGDNKVAFYYNLSKRLPIVAFIFSSLFIILYLVM